MKPKFKSKTARSECAKKGPQKVNNNKYTALDNWLCELYQPHELAPSADNNLSISAASKTLTKSKNAKNPKKLRQQRVNYKSRASEYIKLTDKEYKCAECDFIHTNLVSIRGHYDKEHSKEVYKCTICPFETTQQYYYNSHIKYHSRPDQECPHCKKMIKWFSFKMHIKTHQRDQKTEYKCEMCDYMSYNHANVKRHMLTRHKDPEDLETFKCESCDYVTILEERLKQHRRVVHTKEGVWLSCPECEYTTRNKSHLSRHMNDLHKEKSIRCPECSKLFSNNSNLKYHIKRKHTDKSLRTYYYCEMCPKEQRYKTTEKGNLARHILTHRTLDEIEVFACHKCPYLAKSRNALKTHLINVHLPEIHEFKCLICGYSTSTKSRYTCHVREVHGKPREEKYKRRGRSATVRIKEEVPESEEFLDSLEAMIGDVSNELLSSENV